MAATSNGKKSSKQNNGNQTSQGAGSGGRGFASMEPDRQREIASEGGKASHQGSDQGGQAHNPSGNNRSQQRDDSTSYGADSSRSQDPTKE